MTLTLRQLEHAGGLPLATNTDAVSGETFAWSEFVLRRFRGPVSSIEDAMRSTPVVIYAARIQPLREIQNLLGNAVARWRRHCHRRSEKRGTGHGYRLLQSPLRFDGNKSEFQSRWVVLLRPMLLHLFNSLYDPSVAACE